MKPQVALTDFERFPLLKDKTFLKKLRQDSNAPKYNFKSGDRLTQELLDKVNKYNEEYDPESFWQPGKLPRWLDEYLTWCKATVPAYKEYSESFADLPSTKREQIAQTPWKFVSDDCNVDDLLVYCTSGTTGAPMDVLFDATSQATWIPQIESVLKQDGIKLEGGAGKVSVCLVCCQGETLTYASVSTYLNGAGILKINLNSKDWNKPEDRILYLEKHNPEILTGDPFTFMALAKLKPQISPKAIISSAMILTEGMRSLLNSQFNCKVYDLYSLTECRNIGVSRKSGIYQLIRPELYLEILHPEKDIPVALGSRGEITITGGNNPFLPLIRYRTGDYGSIRFNKNRPELINLEGRNPTIFKNSEGGFVNNVDISRAISEFVLAGFTLHQNKDLSVRFCGWGENVDKSKLVKALKDLFGAKIDYSVELSEDNFPEGKKVQYTSEFKEEEIYP